MLRKILEAYGFDRSLRARLALRARHTLEHHPEVDVLENGVPREERVLLEYESNVVRHRSADALAEDFDRTGGGRDEAAEDVEQRRLSAAARSDQAEQLAARDLERGPAQRADVAGLGRFAELMRDADDPDRDLIGSHAFRQDRYARG